MTDKPTCGAAKKNGDTCAAPPMKGATRCRSHGGASPQSQRKAAQRLADTKAREDMTRAVATLGITNEYADIDPGKALLEEISRTWAHVQWLAAKVADLEDDELVWGTTQRREGIGPEGPIDETTQKAEANAWYRLYCDERDRLARVSAAALKAGIEERRVRLAEEQGALVAQVIRTVLDALNLTADQWATVPEIVPRALRGLTPTSQPG